MQIGKGWFLPNWQKSSAFLLFLQCQPKIMVLFHAAKMSAKVSISSLCCGSPRVECKLVRVSLCQAGKIAQCFCFPCNASPEFCSLSLLPRKRRKSFNFGVGQQMVLCSLAALARARLAGEFGAFSSLQRQHRFFKALVWFASPD